ncbi:MAG: GNAT family N-acetyltransferase [Alphaproteobacteria bacterium]|nr:GNAT family N-acetyltransferase [Alphaproteobacteria bacterium]
MTVLYTTPRLTVRRLGPAQLPALRLLMCDCAAFFASLPHEPDPEREAENLLLDRPPGSAPQDLYALGLYQGDTLVGAANLCAHHPEAGTWFLGLLLMHPDARGQGLAREAVDGLGAWLAAQGARELRAVTHPGDHSTGRLWERLGLSFHREATRGDDPRDRVRIYRGPLARQPVPAL